jgi:hypothetical protein
MFILETEAGTTIGVQTFEVRRVDVRSKVFLECFDSTTHLKASLRQFSDANTLL